MFLVMCYNEIIKIFLDSHDEIELIFKNYNKKLNLKEKEIFFMMINWNLWQLK